VTERVILRPCCLNTTATPFCRKVLLDAGVAVADIGEQGTSTILGSIFSWKGPIKRQRRRRKKNIKVVRRELNKLD
jgi:hypothetical protein